MKNKLDSITIRGFKSIKDQTDFKLNPINVLIGQNGAGKSNFIQVFDLLNNIINRELQSFVLKKGGANKLLHFGQKTTSKIEVNLKFGQNEYYAALGSTNTDNLFFQSERASFFGENYNRPFEIFNRNTLETILDQSSSRGVAKFIHDIIKDWRVYHFHDTSFSSRLRKSTELHNNRFLRDDASNLPAFLYWIKEKHPDHYKQIVNTINLIAPFFKDFILEPLQLREDEILLQWLHNGSDEYFDVNSISDGTLRFICLTTLLLQPKPPSLIILDEPELGLHPFAIRALVELIRKVSVNSQIITTTQSVTFANQLESEEIVIVERNGNESVLKRLEPELLQNWLNNYQDYGLGDLWEKNVLGGTP